MAVACELCGAAGPWTFGDAEEVTILGRTFARARFKGPYPGVAMQYRETVPTGSHHLFVLFDGTYRIDHEDSFNPDAGRGLSHLAFDYLPSRPLLSAVVVGVAVLVFFVTLGGRR